MSDFKTLYQEYKNIIEEGLKENLIAAPLPQQTVFEAMNYSIEAGGKRIRPVLMIATGQMLGLPIDKVLPYACGLEMIHTYSLIHDDLPAMDNDDFRRGRLTNHKVFGEAMAILAGDALLNKAFEVVCEAAMNSDNQAASLKAISCIAKASGVYGMIGGQVIDMESEHKGIPLELLEYMHSHKTGALIKASVLVPAYLASVEQDKLEALVEYSEKLGIAFQVKDDILDVEGNNDVLGKAIGSDEKKGKTTYVTLCGIEKSKILLEELTNQAIVALNIFDEKAEFLKQLAYFLLKREN